MWRGNDTEFSSSVLDYWLGGTKIDGERCGGLVLWFVDIEEG